MKTNSPMRNRYSIRVLIPLALWPLDLTVYVSSVMWPSAGADVQFNLRFAPNSRRNLTMRVLGEVEFRRTQLKIKVERTRENVEMRCE